jgi:putative phosphoribosyl transferase
MALHPPQWSSRHQAGLELAERLRTGKYNKPDSMIIALPRGGVAVAVAIAKQLQLPVATWSVRKVSDPMQPELAIGAIAAGNVVVWRNSQAAGRRQELARRQGWLQIQEQEMMRRQRLFGDPTPEKLRNRHLVVVDDGIATGMTVKAALISLRQAQPSSITLAVPVADHTAAIQLLPLVDHLEALALVNNLDSVGMWYATFNQLSDREVLDLLARSRSEVSS